METKKILLVDGNSLIYRAFFASQYSGRGIMHTKDGIPTNAVYSFANMLLFLINNDNYFDVKVAFDKGKHTFRHDIRPDYKAGRKPTPIELIEQMPIAREFLDSLNVKYYEMDNIEADDLIGTMARKINKEHPEMEVNILSSDKDMYQLITNNTFVLSPRSGTSDLDVVDINRLKEKMGLTPSQILDYKGLCGDSSDNLPGVKGIGDKGAVKLLDKYGTLEGIYQNIEEIKGAQKTKLIDGEKCAFECKQLATIKTDVEIDNFEIKRIMITTDNLVKFLRKYEMNSLINRFVDRSEKINNDTNIEFKVLSNWSHFYECENNDIYVESLDSNYHTGTVIGISIHNEKGNFFINNKTHKQLDIFSMDEEHSDFDKELNDFLNNNNLKKNTYDIKRTVTLLENLGYDVNFDSFVYDMMSVGYLLNPSIKSTFANHLRLIDNSLNIPDDEDFYGKGTKQNPDMDVDKKGEFICKKAHFIGITKKTALEQITKNNQLKLYRDIDLKLIKVLKDMEDKGVLIDRNELIEQTKAAENKMNNIEQEFKTRAKDLIDDNFNISSPKQVAEFLFDKLDLPTKSKRSTNREALEALAPISEYADLILAYRKWAKLYSTYLAGFEKYINSKNRVHTIYNQNLTATGRLSSMEPNLQNISIRDDDQKEVRKIFIADKGYVFYSFDYSQIELRVMAQMADEKHMIDIFSRDGDIHKESAMKIFDIDSPDQVTDEMRRTAKVFNFGIIYGLSDYGLSKDLNISIKEAKELITKYYQEFPGIANFKEKTISFAKQNGYVETLTKRRRYVPEIQSSNKMQQALGERIAVNMPIQGTAADILKIAMIDIYNEFENNEDLSYMCSQIHDEIIFAIKDGEQDKVIPMIKDKMSKAFIKLKDEFVPEMEIKVKLTESQSDGQNWYELK